MRTCLFFFWVTTPLLSFPQWEAMDTGVHNGQIYNMLWHPEEERLYVFGSMYQAGSADLVVNGTAFWDGQWHSMGEGVNPQFVGPVPPVYQGLFYNGDLVVVGVFDSIGGNRKASRIARWDQNDWYGLDTMPTYTGNTYGLSVVGNELHLHGSFDTIQGQAVQNWAIWNGSTWRPGDTTGVFDWSTKEAIEYHGELYVGGNFETMDGRNDLLRKVGDQWVELGAGLQGDCYVSDLEVYNDLLWVTGYFFASAGNAATGIMAWDGTQWLDPFPQVEMYGWGRSLSVANDKLYFTGFMNIAGRSGTYQIGQFDGEELCILGGDQIVTTSVVASADTLFANTCIQMGCNEFGGPVVNGIMKMPLDYPPDTCYSITQGMAERGAYGLVEFYPNPASGTLNITGLGLENSRINLTLFDALGQLVLTSQTRCAGGAAAVELPSLAAGAYQLQVRDQAGMLVRSATIMLDGAQ